MIARVNRLVDRWGRTGFAAVTSLIWALPMAAWAGSVDLQPGPGPWAAFALGAVLLVAWLVMLTRLGRVPVTRRARRWDIGEMSPGERGWNLALAVCATGIIGWLNGAATVDWNLLGPGLGAGQAGAVVFVIALAVLLALLVAGAIYSWRRSAAAFAARAQSAPPSA